jgi:transposase-like protein
MISQIKTYTCAKCASANLVRNGKNGVGNPRYKCKDCSYCGVLESRLVSKSLKERAIAMAQQRSSLRGIARVLGCSAGSVSNWIKKKPSTAANK